MGKRWRNNNHKFCPLCRRVSAACHIGWLTGAGESMRWRLNKGRDFSRLASKLGPACVGTGCGWSAPLQQLRELTRWDALRP